MACITSRTLHSCRTALGLATLMDYNTDQPLLNKVLEDRAAAMARCLQRFVDVTASSHRVSNAEDGSSNATNSIHAAIVPSSYATVSSSRLPWIPQRS